MYLQIFCLLLNVFFGVKPLDGDLCNSVSLCMALTLFCALKKPLKLSPPILIFLCYKGKVNTIIS